MRACATPSQGTEGTLPVRSPSVSFRYSPPSRRERTSTSRTNTACAMSTPSENSLTCMAAAKIEWPADKPMEFTAIVTGGTGGLGVAVVQRLLDDDWRVVVPWIAEHELERVEHRKGL